MGERKKDKKENLQCSILKSVYSTRSNLGKKRRFFCSYTKAAGHADEHSIWLNILFSNQISISFTDCKGRRM